MLEKGQDGKNAFSGVDGEQLVNDSCGRRSVTLGLGREGAFGQFELGKKTVA